MAVTAQQFATNWANGMSAKMDKIRQGITTTQKDWHTATIDAKGFMVSRWQAAVGTSGQDTGTKWDRNVGNTSTAYWRSRALSKGMQNLPAGIDNGRPNVQAFAQQFLPAVQAAAQAAQALPRGGVEQSIARVSAFIRAMSQFQYTRPAR